MLRRLTFLLLASLPARLAGQHPFHPGGQFDPRVPAPKAVLGYEVGERFTPHHLLMRYLERLAAATPRIRLDTVAQTFEGREVMLVIVTSERNQERLEEIRREAQLVAEPGGERRAEARAAAERLPAIAWLGFTVHGGEASGVEAAIALLYQLAAGRDEQTRMVLDSVVILVDPVQNPDGHERHAQDMIRRRGALALPTHPAAMNQSGSWPGPRTSHYYFDLNRDWFLHSHPETRGRVATFFHWRPHVAVDLHEQGSEASYFFAPPMEPINQNVAASILKWWDIYAAANAAAFDERGWPYFRREGYDEFYPGYGVSWPILTGAVGMTYEQASSAGGAIRRRDGTVLTLSDAARHHYTAAWATVVTTARRARERVRDYLGFRETAISDAARYPFRAVVLARDADGRADSLVHRLSANGIQVHRLTGDVTLPATGFGQAAPRPTRLEAGGYVVDLAQPQGRLAKALLEPDAVLDSTFIAEELESRRVGRPDRFYDVTAWSLPYAFRVDAWTVATLPQPLQRVEWIASAPAPVGRAQAVYAFEPGSEPSLRVAAGLLAAGFRLWFAPRSFRVDETRFPRGAFLARVASNPDSLHDAVSRLITETGARVIPLATAAVDSGTDLGSNSVFFVRPPRVGLLGGAPVSGNSFGFAWYLLDQRLGYPVTAFEVQALGGTALDDLDVLVVPSAPAEALDRALGDGGRQRVAQWVRQGGTLVTIEGATGWLASERLGLSRLRARRDTVRADSAGGAALPANVPGAIVRAGIDTLSPLLAGVAGPEIPVPMNGPTIFAVPSDLRPGEAVIRFAPADRLRLAGYLWPEVPGRLAGAPYLWFERVGRGRVIGFAGDPNFRDLWRGLVPVFVNAILLGPSM
jgi:hypothetical protein